MKDLAVLLMSLLAFSVAAEPPFVWYSEGHTLEDIEGYVELVYWDANGDLATACQVWDLYCGYVTTPGWCTAGVCSVGLTGWSNSSSNMDGMYRVYAGGEWSNWGQIVVVVSPVNDTPEITSTPDTTAMVGHPWTYNVIVFDIEGDNIEYFVSSDNELGPTNDNIDEIEKRTPKLGQRIS